MTKLELYVIGHSPRTSKAIENLRRLCETVLRDCELEIVDVLEHPDAAEANNVVVTPTLIRRAPKRVYRVIGDLSAPDVVLRAIGFENPGSEDDDR